MPKFKTLAKFNCQQQPISVRPQHPLFVVQQPGSFVFVFMALLLGLIPTSRCIGRTGSWRLLNKYLFYFTLNFSLIFSFPLRQSAEETEGALTASASGLTTIPVVFCRLFSIHGYAGYFGIPFFIISNLCPGQIIF